MPELILAKAAETIFEYSGPDGALKMPAQLPIGAAIRYSNALGQIGRVYPWRVADFCLYCERTYGEAAAQVMEPLREALGLHPGTLSNMVAVADRIPPPRRRGLPLHVCAVVAYVKDEQEQERLLTDAAQHGWSKERLKEAAGKGRKPKEVQDCPPPCPPHVCRQCGEEWDGAPSKSR